MKEIPLTRGKVAIVDDEDYEYLSQWKWYCENSGYARRTFNSVSVLMHVLLMNYPEKGQIDHINGNKLDNRRSNLRICSHQENNRNKSKAKGKTSKYKGVWFDKSRNRWQAYIDHEYKRYHLGRFKTEIEAAKAYNKKAKELFGQFAKLNKVE